MELLETYKEFLLLTLSRKAHFLDEKTKDDSIVEDCNKSLNSYFAFYEKLRGEVSMEMNLNDDNYECPLNRSNCKFPCIGTFEYRGRKFPVFLDDYGMDTFLVLTDVNNKNCSTQWDWYYFVDYELDLQPMLDADTPEKCYKIIDEINDSTWWK